MTCKTAMNLSVFRVVLLMLRSLPDHNIINSRFEIVQRAAERRETRTTRMLRTEKRMTDESHREIEPAGLGPQAGTGRVGAVKLRPRSFIAIAAMVAIGQGGNKSVPLREVAAAIGVSESYLEQLYSGLRSGGLIRSFRGPGGGYRLAKPAAGISVLDIVVSVERGAIASRKKPVGPRSTRRTHAQYLRDQLEGFQYLLLQHMSLADVASGTLDRNPFLRRLFEGMQREARAAVPGIICPKQMAKPDATIQLPSPETTQPNSFDL
jgi:Rrf2 family transcriptional regulator, iron-sulfur cluster assembly transcription factor